MQKKQISEAFVNGKEISEISESYNFSKQTIIKQLKTILGEETFNRINDNTPTYKLVNCPAFC